MIENWLCRQYTRMLLRFYYLC